MISLRHTLPTPVLPLSVVAFLQPLFETEGIVFPHQETETHGKRDFDFDLLPVFFNFFFYFQSLPVTLLQCRTDSAALCSLRPNCAELKF